ALRERNGQPAGRLHREVFGEALERRAFEGLVAGLVRAGLAVEEADAFERDGERIAFSRVRLTRAGQAADGAALGEVRIAREAEPERAPRNPRRRGGRRTGAKTGRAPARAPGEPVRGPIDGNLYAALVRWRTAEAKRRRVPAFRVLSNATLEGIAAARPRDE